MRKESDLLLMDLTPSMEDEVINYKSVLAKCKSPEVLAEVKAFYQNLMAPEEERIRTFENPQEVEKAKSGLAEMVRIVKEIDLRASQLEKQKTLTRQRGGLLSGYDLVRENQNTVTTTVKAAAAAAMPISTSSKDKKRRPGER